MANTLNMCPLLESTTIHVLISPNMFDRGLPEKLMHTGHVWCCRESGTL